MNRIIRKEMLTPEIALLEVEAPRIARRWKAGNFIIIRPTPASERIPLTIVDGGVERGTITMVVQAIGKTTRITAALEAGDSLADLVGPLGEAASVQYVGRALCRILDKELREAADEVLWATDDGSTGFHGNVVQYMNSWVATQERKPDVVHVIGPIPMMRAAAEATRPWGVRTYASLNPIMIDGTGMCGGCRVTVGGKVRFACVEGPEFDAHEVDFDELARRNRAYSLQEKQVLEEHACKIGLR